MIAQRAMSHTGLGLWLAGVSTACLAQSAPQEPAVPKTDVAAAQSKVADQGFDEITVTARRREENIQTVPLSVTALNPAMLEKSNITQLTDIFKVAPGVDFKAAVGGRIALPTLTIRSLGNTTGNIDQVSPVTLYFAEAPVNRQSGVNGALFDISSVQVLKGPQGTLFGLSTTGGALLIGPQKPLPDLGGYASTLLGDYGRREAEAAVNIPLTDTLAVRVAGKLTHLSGTTTVVNSGDKADRSNGRFGRIGLDWKPIEGFETYLVGDILKFNGGSTTWSIGTNPNSIAATVFFPTLIDDVADQVRRSQNRDTTNVNFPSVTHIHNKGLTDVTTYDLGAVSVKNIAAVRRISFNEAIDADGTPEDVLNVFNVVSTNQWSEELQLSGKLFDNRLDFITGFFTFRERSSQAVEQALFGLSPTTNIGTMTRQSYALFGQATFSLTPRFRLTGGLRYSINKTRLQAEARLATGDCDLYDAQDNPLPNDQCSRDVHVSYHPLSYTLVADYRLNQHAFFYVTRRQSSRDGGFEVTAHRDVEFTPVKPEFVRDIEGGVKLDGHLGGMPFRADLATFYAKYSDIQRNVNVTTPRGNIGSELINAARATIYGGELELSLKPTKLLEITGFASMSKPKFDKFVDPFTGEDFTSQEFGSTPIYSGRIDLNYRLPVIPESKGELHVIGAYRYQGKSVFGQDRSLATVQRGFGVADLRAEWQRVGGSQVDLAVFATNVFDKRYITQVIDLSQALGVIPASFGDRRMIGGSAKITF